MKRRLFSTISLASLGATMGVMDAQAQTVEVGSGMSSGPVIAARLYNYGSIDGGNETAVTTNGSDLVSGGAYVENHGLIQSTSSSATLLFGDGIINTLINDGHIHNMSSGNAVEVHAATSIYNRAGGVIESSQTAISALWGGRLLLTNSGAVIGAVNGGGADDFVSLQDPDTLSFGSIGGDVSLGGGDDFLMGARIDPATGQILNISGAIDGGAGRDTLVPGFEGDGVLERVVLPTGFEDLQLRALFGQTITVSENYQGPTSFILNGPGSFVMQATIAALGPAITSDGAGYTLVNDGTISGTLPSRDDALVTLGAHSTLINNGLISAIGGKAVQDADYVQIINVGTVESSGGDAMALYGAGTVLTNSGTISSDQTALAVRPGAAASAGVSIINSGSIVSPAGLAILVDGSVDIVNQAGAVIRGRSAAIARAANGGGVVKITNAGLIDGFIDMVSQDLTGVSTDTYTMQGNGLVTGSIYLGNGDDQINVEAHAGVVGPIALGGLYGGDGFDSINYRTESVSSITLPPLLSGFEQLSFQADGVDSRFDIGGAIRDIALVARGSGQLVIGAGSYLLGSASLTLDGIRAENRGIIDVALNDTAVTLKNSANFENFGTILSSGLYGLRMSDSNFTNRGSIRGNVSAVIADNKNQKIYNYGRITSDQGWGIFASGGTEIYNFGGGVVSARRAAIARSGSENFGIKLYNEGYIGGYIDFGIGDVIGVSDLIEIRNSGKIEGNIYMGPGDDLINIYIDGIPKNSGYAYMPISGWIYGGDGKDTIAFITQSASGWIKLPDVDQRREFESLKFIADGQDAILTVSGVIMDTLVETEGSGTVIYSGRPQIYSSNGMYAAAAVTINRGILYGVQVAPGVTFQNEGNVAGLNDGVVVIGSSDPGIVRTVISNSNVIRSDGNAISMAPYCDGCWIHGGVDFDNSGTVLGHIDLRPDAQIGSSVSNLGQITGNLLFGSANDYVLQRPGGVINGSIDMGDGYDRFVGQYLSKVTGQVDGGAGYDVAVLNPGGTEGNPEEMGLERYVNFEMLELEGRVGSTSGTSTFGNVALYRTGLVGTTSSVINTALLTVSNDSFFGTAGLVNGNVRVLGTLRPGVAGGIMTVNGNVAMEAGSTATFQFGVAHSDQLVINGALNIADGTVLNLTGSRPLTPGVAYDIIVAQSITGRFTTVNQASSVEGVLSYGPSSLQLLGTFVQPTEISTQAAATVAYVNDVIAEEEAKPVLLAAMPILLSSDGIANAQAFDELAPEAYATASQIGVDHGLAIVKSIRAGAVSARRDEAGFYSFAQGMQDWRSLNGNAAGGVAGAKSRTSGVMGGLGYGDDQAHLAAFVGYLDGRQKIDGLGTQTDVDGMFAGLTGHVSRNAFDMTVSVVFDWSDASTRRTVADGFADGDYGIDSLILDAEVGYNVSLATGWVLRPALGLTYISTKRKAVVETGGSALAMVVDSERTESGFIDAGISLMGGQASNARFHPWAGLGLRQQLSGNRVSANAGFAGTSMRYTVNGARRDELQFTANAGGRFDVTSNFGLFVAYQGEFGGGTGTNVSVGGSLAF